MYKFGMVVLFVALVFFGYSSAAHADSVTFSDRPLVQAAVTEAGKAVIAGTEKATVQSVSPAAKEGSRAVLFVPVPEPGTSVQLLFGLLGLALVCRKFVRG